VASFWEVALKLSKGGFDIELPERWDDELIAELREIGSVRLEIQPAHCRRLHIAQADAESLAVITVDRRFKKYRVKVVW